MRRKLSELLKDCSIHHAGIKPVMHPRLKAVINSQTAVRYLRFLRPVTLDRLELKPVVYGRWVPNVPTHPAHLIISILDARTLTWKDVREVNLPPDPRIAGQGLSQSMTMDEVNAHFASVLKDPPRVIELGGLRTDQTPLWQLAERAGMVLQNTQAQMLASTVEDEIAFGLENLGLARAEIEQRIEASLDRFGLQNYRAHDPRRLSGGEGQRVMLAAMPAKG